MDIDFSEIRRQWPAGLILNVLNRSVRSTDDVGSLRLLLDESCVDKSGLPLSTGSGFKAVPDDTWARNVFDDSDVSEHERYFEAYGQALREALKNDSIPRYQKRAYYSQKQRSAAGPTPSLKGRELADELCNVIGELDHDGYFDSALGDSCSDARVDRKGAARDVFWDRLGAGSHWEWPPRPNDYAAVFAKAPLDMKDDLLLDHVCDLLEVCHDLVARPSKRSRHDFHDEWDYFDFDRESGQQVYRWRINTVLKRSKLDLQLSSNEPDVGSLVHAPADPRAELTQQSLQTALPEDSDRISHAIAKFRARDATREDKRDAVKALGDVLESRRSEVKDILGGKDENTLFEILNTYDIRHHRAAQKNDYAEDFLDWIFWTFLASVAFMSNRLEGPDTR